MHTFLSHKKNPIQNTKSVRETDSSVYLHVFLLHVSFTATFGIIFPYKQLYILKYILILITHIFRKHFLHTFLHILPLILVIVLL